MLSRLDLRRAEAKLRQDDRALRLRRSVEQPNTILIERKTFRGRIGHLSPCSPDSGRRREEGHVLVGSIPASLFDTETLRLTLREADTWRHPVPLWRRVEEADEQARAARIRARRDGLRYRASELFDRYVWRYKQRVSVPVQIQ